jgi:glyoxylase-like metal-dependent hydrolase (beta-lactamase superfamily II)
MIRKLAALLLLAGCEATLPPAPPHANVQPRPDATPVQVCWLEYAHHDTPGGYALAGPSQYKTWTVTSSGLLIRHPKGHLLLDLGVSTHFDEELSGSGLGARPFLHLAPGSIRTEKTALQGLTELGETPAQLKALVISHVHPDHAGGLVDLPSVPVLLPKEELDFAERLKDRGAFAVTKQHVEALENRAVPLAFADAPYENFEGSIDYFGDGSVVFVRLFGHTPGSLGTFVTLGGGHRLFHVGDATNSVEAIEKRVGKGYSLYWTDEDQDRADAVLSKLSQLHEQDPAVAFIPSHDRRAWEALFPGGPGTCIGG